ncbi:hypothetical protein [Plantactinospora sp. GCM10030261]|uniref:hypothetical protein n=1 Tax=Plantactinospora sp. GCM10030261 TaxID=3273420 RepID=UPI00361E828F
MLRIVTVLSDRLLDLVAPKAVASAADCGSPRYESKCEDGVYLRRQCWTNSNCVCGPWRTSGRC